MLILKEVKKAKQDHQRRKAKKTAFKYSKKLIEDGWYQIPVEGALFFKKWTCYLLPLERSISRTNETM